MESPLIPPSKSAASVLVPLQLHWDGYTQEEIVRRAQIRRLDAAVVPCFGAWYLLQAMGAAEAPASFPQLEVVSSAAFLTRLVLAAAATYVIALHTLAFPAPTASQEAYKVQSRMGRWVYLTRHAVALQAWHQVLSLFAMLSPNLELLTHGISIFVASLGWFVTVQYFLLVVPNAGFKEDCKLWKGRGVQFEEVGILLHAPALLIALLDMTLAKNGAMLEIAVSLQKTIALVMIYIVVYVSVISVNFQMTDHWPYKFMNDFGLNLKKWGVFISGQSIVMLAFTSINIGIFIWRTSSLGA